MHTLSIFLSPKKFSQNCLKQQVLNLFLKRDSQTYNKYRPFSLILNLSQLIEKLAHKRLHNFLDKHSLLFEKQYGFRTKISTNHALNYITNKLQESCDKGSFACGVFDFKKAFGSVKNILPHKLNHYGVRGTESNWFKSYLGARQQHPTFKLFFKKCLWWIQGSIRLCPRAATLPNPYEWSK